MANGVKTFSIKINGIDTSIDAVKSLEKELFNLEQRIAAVSKQAVNIKSSGGDYGGGSTKASNASSLSEEEKLEKQILQTEAKREAYSKEIYQNYLAAKEQLSETVKDQKQLAAAERLSAGAYSNTMKGMKQELADIKEVMQTVDLGDSDQFDKLTQRANELNEKLKEIEATYGQFGRNVGNYESAFNGLDKLVIKVGTVDREFNSAREASKTLKNELYALEIQGKSDTKEADNLRQALYKLQSAMNDATKSSRAMDTAMDWMESFTSMATVGRGFSAFFGLDSTEITKSIQELVALQGALKGIENIRKQMETKEGIGKILGKGFDKIDTWIIKLQEFNTKLFGTGKAAKAAEIGVKGFGLAIKTIVSAGIYFVLNEIISLLQKGVAALKDWAAGNADLVTAEGQLKASLEATNNSLERQLQINGQLYDKNQISLLEKKIADEKAYAKALAEANEELKNRMNLNPSNSTFADYATGRKTEKDIYASGTDSFGNFLGMNGDKGVTTFGGFKEAIKDEEDLIKRYKELSKAVAANTGLVMKNAKGLDICHLSASDAKDELNHLEQIMGGSLVRAMQQFDISTEEGRKGLQDFVNGIQNSNSTIYKSVLLKLPEIVSNEKGQLGTALQGWLDIIMQFVNNANAAFSAIDFENYVNNILDSADETGKRLAEKQKKQLTDRYNLLSKEEQKKEKENYEKGLAAIDKMQAKKNQKLVNAEKKTQKDIDKVNKEIEDLKLQRMKEGWEKEKKQLENERQAKLKEALTTGIKVKELQNEINKTYDKKLKDAEADFRKREAQAYAETWEQIYRSTDERVRMHLDNELMQYETELKKYKEIATNFFRTEFSSYGGIQFNTSVKDSQKIRLGFGNSVENSNNGDIWLEDQKKKAKEYIKLADEVKTSFGGAYWVAEKALNDWLAANQTTEEEMEKLVDVQILRANDFNKSIDKIYNARINQVRLYYEKIEELEKLHADRSYENEIELLKNETNAAKREETSRYASQMSRLQENFNNGLIAEKEYQEARVRITDEWSQNLITIGEKYDAESERLEQEHQDRLKEITAEGFRGRIQEFRDAYAAMSNIQARQPQTDKAGFGLVNISATRKNYKDALNAFESLSRDVQKERENLDEAFNKLSEKNKQLFYDDYQQSKRELDQIGQDAVDAALETQEKLDNVIGEFIQSANQYFQFAMQGFQQIMQALWSAEDVAFDKEQEALNKENDRLQEALDKNEEILERHSNNVNDIEDELQSARGDRRQHLIDQLNAETAAEREAAQEKKRLEKEQEAQQRKQDALDKKRKEAQYKRDLANILISGALAAVNAYATKPFVPVGLTMGSLAIALTAAQYAIAKSARPFKDGGVLEGPSHANGGIKVYGGRAELEGMEYITNKQTTQRNVDLLDYINSKKRRLDLNDFIDFYSSGKVKESIKKISPHTKYANGGVLTLPNNIDFNRDLIGAFNAYSNRPVVVDVREITSKQESIHNVRVLAGLED